VGFSVFTAWLVLLWRSAGMAQKSRHAGMRVVALAGQLALLAFIPEGFSVDSFAIPYLWLWLGLISASGLIFRRSLQSGPAAAPVHQDDADGPQNNAYGQDQVSVQRG